MKIDLCYIAFFMGMLSFGAIYIICGLIVPVVKGLKYKDEPHHCNKCQLSFLLDDELQYKYCPYCSSKLDYHEDDEDNDMSIE